MKLNLLSSFAFALFVTSASAATPAETKIKNARATVESNPDQAGNYAPLAFAYAARARETADSEYYSRGMEAAEKALELEPDHFDAEKAKVWILLGQHEFQLALEMARALNRRNGDDPMVYAMLADAAIETGHYEEAEEAAQWALDMAPGSATSLTRAAYLREHFGDIDGAIDLMQAAYNSTRPAEKEDLAWITTHVGHLYLLKNEAGAAVRAHQEALEIFPGYHYALLNLAHAKTALGDHEAALELHRKHFAAAGHPENRYELAKALRRAGRDEEADKEFALFEEGALGESENVDNANRELTAYYIDEAKRPGEALRIAKIELGNRQDFRTRYAYARALHANGRYAEAYEEMEKTLEIGVKYPEMQFHAGVIARDAGDEEAAKKYFDASVAQSPSSEVAVEASKALQGS